MYSCHPWRWSDNTLLCLEETLLGFLLHGKWKDWSQSCYIKHLLSRNCMCCEVESERSSGKLCFLHSKFLIKTHGFLMFWFMYAPSAPIWGKQSFHSLSFWVKIEGSLYLLFFLLVKKLNAVLPPYLSFRWDGTTVRCLHERSSSFSCRSNWKQMIQVTAISHILCPFQLCSWSSFPELHWHAVRQHTSHSSPVNWWLCCLLPSVVWARLLLQVLFQDKCTVGTWERKAFSPKLL